MPLRSTARLLVLIGSIAVSTISAFIPALAAGADPSTPIKIAVFDFELEDVSAGSSLSNGPMDGSKTRLKDVSGTARGLLQQSGRYTLVDVSKSSAGPVIQKSLRNCDGCDAAIALQLGADESLIGVLKRVSPTEYYVLIRISDARTGKVLNQQDAAFLGDDNAMASGVSSLIRHGILTPQD